MNAEPTESDECDGPDDQVASSGSDASAKEVLRKLATREVAATDPTVDVRATVRAGEAATASLAAAAAYADSGDLDRLRRVAAAAPDSTLAARARAVCAEFDRFRAAYAAASEAGEG